MFDKIKEKASQYKTKAVAAVATGITMAGTAAAETNSSIADVGPIIQDAANLMPYILALIISIAGVIIGMAIIRFVTGLFDSILQGLRFR